MFAFILNLAFAIFEFFGGILTNSVAIFSDSVHDLGDAASIGISYFLERKSKKKADNKYTYGYVRFSVLGGVITTVILLVGSILVIAGAIKRIFSPVIIDYGKMIVFAVIGVAVNFIAAYLTHHGDSVNQKAVNLHMLEDVLGWAVVLAGAILMKFTDISVIDPLMSIGVSVFILVSSLHNLKKVLDIFLEKTPNDVDIECLKEHLMKIDGIDDIHHIHVWSIDGYNNYATMHLVSKSEDIEAVKSAVRKELREHNICHSVLETESESCDERECNTCVHVNDTAHHGHHGHHGHH